MAQTNMTRRQLTLSATGAAASWGQATPNQSGPRIQFIRVPMADGNGTDKHDVIEGRVDGFREGQQIVLYARNGSWWLQPLLEAPFTRIQASAKWHNATHLGSDYAALLVEPGYRPPRKIDALPAVGGLVAAVAVTKGAAVSPSATLKFGGYEWRLRSAVSNRGGRNNFYSPGNAWTDAQGALHLRIAQKNDRWACAEISLNRSFGYGTYSFLVRDTSRLPPDVTFEMFTWDYSGTDQNNREMDVVIRRPQSAENAKARFVVQPYHVASNLHEFDVPPGALWYSFRWETGRISFTTASGKNPKRVVAQHAFTLGIPTPGVESVRMAIYQSKSAAPDPVEAEVVVDRFEYTP